MWYIGGEKKFCGGKSMAMLQGNTYQVPVQVTDCKGEVIVPSMVERGQFVFGALGKFYGDGGEVWWNEELRAFMVPLTEDETFAFKGAVKYQARLLLKDGSISGTIPQSEYIRESITGVRLSDGGAGVQSGSILKASLLKEVASVISNVVVDEELDAGSENAISNSAVTNAINRVEAIAKGAQMAVAYKTYQEAVTAINGLGADAYNVGQNIMIFTLSVPDLWISEVEETSEPYVYAGDDAIVSALKADGLIRVGHYTLSALETGKVDLENYYTKNETDDLIAGIPQGIETLIGTEDKPINLATDLIINNYYIMSGYLYIDSNRIMSNLPKTLVYRIKSNGHIIFFNIRLDVSASGYGYNQQAGYYTEIPVTNTGDINYRYITYNIPLEKINGGLAPRGLFAPTNGGTQGQILQSNGIAEPTWVDVSTAGLATTTDIEAAIGNVSSLLGNTEDLEV